MAAPDPKEIRDAFSDYRDEWQIVRDEAAADMQAISPEGPWSSQDRAQREDTGRPCLHLDQINQYLNQSKGNVRKNKRAIKAIPKGDGANDQDAKRRSTLIMGIEDRSRAQPIYLNAYESMIERSYGFAVIRTEFKDSYESETYDPSIFDLEIIVKPILNPDTVLLNPSYKQPDASDITDAFLLELIPKAQFKKKYPKAEITDFNGIAAETQGSSDWIKDKYVQTAEYWKVEHDTIKLLLVEGPAGLVVVTEKEFKESNRDKKEVKRERKVEVPRVVQYMTNGLEILDEVPWAGSRIPIISCLGPERWRTIGGNAKRELFSMVRFAREPQMLFDFLSSQECEEAGMVPKVPFVGYKGQFESDKETWETLNHVPHSYAQVDIVVDGATGQILPVPTRPQYIPNFQQYELAKDSAGRAIQSGMGISPLPTAAARRNEKSGVALERIDDMESLGNFMFVDRYENCFLYNMGWQINELITPILDTQREQAVSDPDGTRTTMHLVGNTSHPIDQDGAYDVQGSDGQPLPQDHLHTGKGDFDVTIDTGPSQSSEREEQDDFVDTLITNIATLPMPGTPAAKVLALGIRMRPTLGPIGQKIADIFDPPDPSNLPPEAQAVVAQLQAQLQQAQQESSALHMDRAGKVLEQQTKILMEQMKQDGENNRAQLNNDIKVLLGEIAAKAQDANQRQQLYQEFVKLNHVQAHEAAMQAVDHQHQAAQASQAQQAQALQAQQATPTPSSPQPGA